MPCLLGFVLATNDTRAVEPARFHLNDAAMRKAAEAIDEALEGVAKTYRDRDLADLDQQRIDDAPWLTPKIYDARRVLILDRTGTPSVTSDEVFVRRVWLDVTGCIPSSEAVQSFLQDASPDKRMRLVDQLLFSPGRARHIFNHLASALRLRDEVKGVSMRPYLDWVHEAAASNMHYNDLVYELISARGTLKESPATGFLLRDEGIMSATAEELASTFLDLDLTCARCHDHPFSDGTQRGYYEFASIFCRTKTEIGGAQPSVSDTWKGHLSFPEDYKYRDGEPGTSVPEASTRGVLGTRLGKLWSSPLEEGSNNGAQVRGDFAVWLTSSSNQRFAGAIAWQMWERFFGGYTPARGFVELPDDSTRTKRDLRGGKCEAYPGRVRLGWITQTLDNHADEETSKADQRLASSLVTAMQTAKYDLRDFERILLHTRAYQREAVPGELGGHPCLRPAPHIRRLTAEQIWDSLQQLTTEAAAGDTASDRQRMQLPIEHGLRRLGRGRHELSFDSQPFISHDTSLFMMNDERVAAVCGEHSVLLHRLATLSTPAEKADAAFLAVLSRKPSEREKQAAVSALSSGKTDLPALVWSLLNTSEFLFQH